MVEATVAGTAEATVAVTVAEVAAETAEATADVAADAADVAGDLAFTPSPGSAPGHHSNIGQPSIPARNLPLAADAKLLNPAADNARTHLPPFGECPHL